MKNTIALTLVLLLCLSIFSACKKDDITINNGEESDIVGIWKPDQIEEMGTTYTINEYESLYNFDFNVTYEFMSDGVVVCTNSGFTYDGTYKVNDHNVEITSAGITQTWFLNGGKLIIPSPGSEEARMICVKK